MRYCSSTCGLPVNQTRMFDKRRFCVCPITRSVTLTRSGSMATARSSAIRGCTGTSSNDLNSPGETPSSCSSRRTVTWRSFSGMSPSCRLGSVTSTSGGSKRSSATLIRPVSAASGIETVSSRSRVRVNVSGETLSTDTPRARMAGRSSIMSSARIVWRWERE